MKFIPEFGESLITMQHRIFELQQMRATLGTPEVIKYCDRRIIAIAEAMNQLRQNCKLPHRKNS